MSQFKLTREDYNAVIRQRAMDLGKRMECFGCRIQPDGSHCPDERPAAVVEELVSNAGDFFQAMQDIYALALEREELAEWRKPRETEGFS